MSSRALKRLEKQRNESLSNLASDSQEVSESEESEYESRPKASFNAFALLNGDDESENEEEVPNTEKNDKKEENEPEVSLPPKNSKSSRKKKKNKKPAKKPVDSDEELDQILIEAKKKDEEKARKSKGSTAISADVDEDEYDFEVEYDEILEPASSYDSNFKQFTMNRLKQSLPLLSIGSIRNLDSDHEFKGLFGNLSMETIDDANTTTSLAISPEVLQQFKKLARLTRGWCGKDRRGVPGTTRKLLLTRIRDDWLPTTQKPMSMEELRFNEIINYLDYKEDTADFEDLEFKLKKELSLGVKYFRFNKINTTQERVANSRFYASVVMTPDPESLMHLLQQYPYHAETLLQVAMVLLRQGSDKSTSNALIEKCLFVFDRTFHKNFHELLNEGKNGLVRLPYESFLNRQFYLCLFRYIMNLGERSTFLTALSYCKFLLSLSPAEDPLGVRYFLDYYSIMSEEYEYLIRFTKSPLVTTYEKWLTPGLAFSTVLAYLNLDDVENAKSLLKVAYQRYPYASYKLLEIIGLSHDIPIKEHEISTNDEMVLAAETYLVRAGIMWNDQSKRQFLHDELLRLFKEEKINSSKGSITSSIYGLFTSFQKADTPNKEIPFNLIRFAILSGENKIMAKVPESVWARDDVYEYDILPPQNDTVKYNEFTGVNTKQDQVVDSLLTYVDQNVIGSIIQNQTEEDDFTEVLRQLQLQETQQDQPQEEDQD